MDIKSLARANFLVGSIKANWFTEVDKVTRVVKLFKFWSKKSWSKQSRYLDKENE